MSLAGGIWINEFSGTLRDTGQTVAGWPSYRRRTLYEYTASIDRPATLHVDGKFIRPDRHFFTDLASVPEFLQLLVPKDCHNPSSWLHDSACLFHGVYIADDYLGPYEFTEISSRQAHLILGKGFHAGRHEVRAHIVYNSVRLCGPRWDVGDPPDRGPDQSVPILMAISG